MPPSLHLQNVSVSTPSGRALFRDLNLRLNDEHVGVVGRNGVGKSTLLSLLAGTAEPSSGHVHAQGARFYLPQVDEQELSLSRGEQRRLALETGRASGADFLLLDEPTLHLDDAGVAWLRAWLGEWKGGLIVASHDQRLLADLRHFFVVSEAGCHYFGGSLAELELHLEREHAVSETRYVSNLHRLAEQEAHTEQVARRKARKKRRGRCAELDRATPRIRLNQKRAQAQVSHGRLAKLRQAKLAELRGWTQASRRAVNVELALELAVPELPPSTGADLLALQGVSASAHGRRLFDALDLRIGRERVAVVGPNGAGKTTLLQIMTGQRRPENGTAKIEHSKVGCIEQGGRNWRVDASLRAHLLELGRSSDEIASLLVTHRFPLALAERPLHSLSPGERARAALIALFARAPSVELLVLDEPTFGLDLVGQRALIRALAHWPGGLVVASHDQAFLDAIGIDQTIRL
ncbi:MAG TPA: ATP-binding cassette domain-containing protein [Polyangiaceae bacterium]|nr:ATP-binding cassette domain-containing protein [Polyangiaceae bacterium]